MRRKDVAQSICCWLHDFFKKKLLRACEKSIRLLFNTECINRCKTLNKITMIKKTFFKTKDYCKVKFSVNIENAETVEILGLNSDWNTSITMSKRKDGTFTCDVSLPKGQQHQYKYLVNETEWITDPEADAQLPNEFGGNNSVVIL